MGLLRGSFGRQAAAERDFDYLSTFKTPVVGEGAASAGKRGAPSEQDVATRRDHADIVIVGNGIAGCTAAIEARRQAPDAEIIMVTDQNHPTINTPALKQFGAGRIELEQLLAHPPRTERQLRIGLAHGRVTGLDARAREVRLRGDQRLTYGRLLLATGSRPVALPQMPGATFDGVMTLHTLSDYLDLRRRLPGVSRAVVIGGGYHAAETALLLREVGVEVTWLIRGRVVTPSLLDPAASDQVIQYVRRRGVDARLETEVVGVVGRVGVAVGALTSADEFVPGQLVIAAIGARPNSELVLGAALAPCLSGGLRVNERLQTQAAGLYAAGAVADVLNPETGAWESRGQWYFAFQQGRLAGAALTDTRIPSGAELGAVGAFWHATQLGALRVLAAGSPTLGGPDDTTFEARMNGSASFYRRVVLRDNRLVGYLATGATLPSGLAIKRMIDERLDVREIASKLLSEEFDAQAYFAQRRVTSLRATGEQQAVKPTPKPQARGA